MASPSDVLTCNLRTVFASGASGHLAVQRRQTCGVRVGGGGCQLGTTVAAPEPRPEFLRVEARRQRATVQPLPSLSYHADDAGQERGEVGVERLDDEHRFKREGTVQQETDPAGGNVPELGE